MLLPKEAGIRKGSMVISLSGCQNGCLRFCEACFFKSQAYIIAVSGLGGGALYATAVKNWDSLDDFSGFYSKVGLLTTGSILLGIAVIDSIFICYILFRNPYERQQVAIPLTHMREANFRNYSLNANS